jgi:hypothetical protein
MNTAKIDPAAQITTILAATSTWSDRMESAKRLVALLREQDCRALDDYTAAEQLMKLVEKEKPTNLASLSEMANEAGQPYFQGVPKDDRERVDHLRNQAKGTLTRLYYEDVDEAAEDLLQMVRDGEVREPDEFSDAVWEHLDGHQRVIYTHLAIECVTLSQNDGAYHEETGEFPVDDGVINWSLLAFAAFKADIHEALEQKEFECWDEDAYAELRGELDEDDGEEDEDE